ncbi:hypothetical protein [Pedococcus sp. P5_B7]
MVDSSHRNWISYSAFQNCVGTFDVQQVCVELQEKDYFGNFYNRTNYECSVQTVMPQAFKGRSVLCSQAEHGTFRSAAYGLAWPDGVRWQSVTRYSYSATLC